MDLIWSPRTIALWTAMKTRGDDVESRCGKHLWTNFRPLGVSKTCLDAGRDFNILLLSLADSTAAKNDQNWNPEKHSETIRGCLTTFDNLNI